MSCARPAALLPVCFVLAISTAAADWKIVSKYRVNGVESIDTRYIRGRNMRWETGRPATIANIWNADRRAFFELDLKAGKYSEPPPAGPLLTLATWIRRTRRIHESG